MPRAPGCKGHARPTASSPNLYGVFAESPAALDADVLTILALKTLSNYTDHIAETPLDPVFEPQRWEKRTQPNRDAASPSALPASALGGAR